jgi:ankyrin repeat protein
MEANFEFSCIVRMLSGDFPNSASVLHFPSIDRPSAQALGYVVELLEDTAIALQILAVDYVDINLAGRNGMTALHSATVMGNIPIIAVLLAKDNLDPNMLDEAKWAPLTYDASQGDLRMVELFLARRDIQVNVQQAPPLFTAIIKGHLDVLRRLLCFDTININQTYRGESPLCVASAMVYLEVTKLLLRHTPPPNINFKTYIGCTALSLAASHGHSDIVALLLEEKSLDVSATDTFEETALYHAAWNGHEQVVMHLCKDPRA